MFIGSKQTLSQGILDKWKYDTLVNFKKNWFKLVKDDILDISKVKFKSKEFKLR